MSLFIVTEMTKGFFYGFVSGAWIVGMMIFIILRAKGSKARLETQLRKKITWREYFYNLKR